MSSRTGIASGAVCLRLKYGPTPAVLNTGGFDPERIFAADPEFRIIRLLAAGYRKLIVQFMLLERLPDKRRNDTNVALRIYDHPEFACCGINFIK